jgi:hypothetical protein
MRRTATSSSRTPTPKSSASATSSSVCCGTTQAGQTLGDEPVLGAGDVGRQASAGNPRRYARRSAGIRSRAVAQQWTSSTPSWLPNYPRNSGTCRWRSGPIRSPAGRTAAGRSRHWSVATRRDTKDCSSTQWPGSSWYTSGYPLRHRHPGGAPRSARPTMADPVAAWDRVRVRFIGRSGIGAVRTHRRGLDQQGLGTLFASAALFCLIEYRFAIWREFISGPGVAVLF